MYRIAVTGPESTGKSALTKALAARYGSPHVPEYAREYVEQLGRPYRFEDVVAIAQQQIEAEKQFSENNEAPYVFFDTELIITKVWFEYCYGSVPDFLQEALDTGYFDLYLLCEPDLPWEPDPVREHGEDRDYFFERYKQEIELLGKPYFSINGTGEARVNNAISAIESFFNNKKTSNSA